MFGTASRRVDKALSRAGDIPEGPGSAPIGGGKKGEFRDGVD